MHLVDPLLDQWKPEAERSDWKPSGADAEGFHKPDRPHVAKQLSPAGQAEEYRQSKRPDKWGRDPELMADFRLFLVKVWKFLGLPRPSSVLLSLAWWLQHGPTRQIILGFRGMSKSWVTGCFALWCLYCNPDTKVLIVSASLDRAVQHVNWALTLIRNMPELSFLEPGPQQRSSTRQFDVGPTKPAQSPSFKAVGITGQIAGSRADVIIPDDVEVPNNSMTVEMRTKISEAVKELDAVITPGGLIKYLGTPQVDDSLYVKLTKRGYTMRIWPAEYPNKKMRVKYGDRLSPFILNRVLKDPTLVGRSVWPERFPDEDLAQRRLSYGSSGYALQFLLDTSLSDADKYPLKLRDLIIHAVDREYGPDVVTWGNAPDLVLGGDIPLLGFEGDYMHAPASVSKTTSKFNSIKASIDSSGRGSNETTLQIAGELSARIFLLYQGGWRDGYAVPTLQEIAKKCVEFRVNTLVIEDNFGDGMFMALLVPHINKAWQQYNVGKPDRERGGTTVEAIRSPRVQKEVRILSVLEPAIQGHRVIVSSEVVSSDYHSTRQYQETVGSDHAHQYSLFYQLTHLSRERDSLLQDDRIEGLAMLVAQFSTELGIDPWESAQQREDDRMEEELEALIREQEENLGIGSPSRRWDRAHHSINPH